MMNKTELVIHNLVSLTRTLLQKVDAQDIIAGRLYFNNISYETAAGYMHKDELHYLNYSHMECLQMAESSGDYVCDQDAHRMHIAQRGKIHLFALLLETVSLLLTETQPVICQYNQLLSWRNLSKEIGEELPVCAMYALLDSQQGKDQRTAFDWECVLPHNNHQLNVMVQRGISDHHFHLFASIPYFQVSWVNLMNSVCDDQFERRLCEIESQNSIPFPEQYIDNQLARTETDRRAMSPFVLHHLQAALIRFYLCCRLDDREVVLPKSLAFDHVMELLRSPEELALFATELQSLFFRFRIDSSLDYALSFFPFLAAENRETECAFYGERWFLYTMLRDIYADDPTRRLSAEEQNLFYAYLCLQNEMRMQMVQTNNSVGFDNFQNYQRRHGYFFTDNAETGTLSVRLAVQEPLLKAPYLQEIEARIAPADCAEKNYQFVSQLDRGICASLEHAALAGVEEEPFDLEAFKKRFYYVFHFIKRPDKREAGEHRDVLLAMQECRHAALRMRLEQQAGALVQFRETYPNTASRVKGIDAASQEIGCRPEVFAPVFRMLGNSVPENQLGVSQPLSRLRKTYHAGEDFLDVIDGLRAIDEAVQFLNLDCGDRIGHAIALGIDAEAWYRGKAYQVSLSAQDHLDNLAWMYHALKQMETDAFQPLKEYLLKQFDLYFREVYLIHMDEGEMDSIMRNAEAYYAEDQSARTYRAHRCAFNIDLYYKAWTLRGDDPKLYRDGFYKPADANLGLEKESTNTRFPRTFADRYIPECALLYYNYHYNPSIKAAGKRQISIPIRSDYGKACAVIQKWMCTRIAQCGIAIETNPSSNVLISTFRDYARHPLYRFYNRHLSSSAEQDACAQLNVSINTDDNGVFFTSLENEYALMARAAELVCDEEGKPLYKKADIYEWLDNIRKMGNDQTFQQ